MWIRRMALVHDWPWDGSIDHTFPDAYYCILDRVAVLSVGSCLGLPKLPSYDPCYRFLALVSGSGVCSLTALASCLGPPLGTSPLEYGWMNSSLAVMPELDQPS